jgi:serine/threonine protein kinase
VDRGGGVKVIDMGHARFTRDVEAAPVTGCGTVLPGATEYTAPERFTDPRGVDTRADVYGLGATFYFCLTGHAPYRLGTAYQMLNWLQTRQPESVRRSRPDVPEGLAALIERMMAKDRALRPQTPQQVADALAPYTAEPIGPPPEHEMPCLSPAAR